MRLSPVLKPLGPVEKKRRNASDSIRAVAADLMTMDKYSSAVLMSTVVMETHNGSGRASVEYAAARMVGDAALDAATDLRISARADAAIGKRARAHAANRGDAAALESLRGPDRFHRHRGPGGRGKDYADAGRRLATSALYRS